MKIFLFFFWKAIKIAGLAQKKKKNNAGWVSRNIGIFLGLNIKSHNEKCFVFTYISCRKTPAQLQYHLNVYFFCEKYKTFK